MVSQRENSDTHVLLVCEGSNSIEKAKRNYGTHIFHFLLLSENPGHTLPQMYRKSQHPCHLCHERFIMIDKTEADTSYLAQFYGLTGDQQVLIQPCCESNTQSLSASTLVGLNRQL